MAKLRAAALVGLVTKAKDYARQHPEQTSDAIGKVEGFVRSKAGPQHAAKVGKGGDALRKGLGVRAGGSTGTAADPDGQVPPPPVDGSRP